jgi:hypothetical protein
MATEQQLAQALSPYDPNYLQNLALGQGTPSLLGNTTVKQPNGFAPMQANPDRDNAYVDPNPAWTDLTPTQRAEYYQDPQNALMAGITQLGQKGFALSGLGRVQNFLNPTIQPAEAQIALGITPQQTFRASEMAQQDAVNNAFAMQSMQDALAADTAAAQAANQSGSPAGAGLGTGDGGMGSGGGRSAGDSDGTTSSTSSDTGTGNPGESFFHGGKVNKAHLAGPDPKGPDDGYGALQGGEYVIKKAAVRKYGEGMLGKINAGKYAPRG